MQILVKIIVSVLIFPAVYPFSYWVLFAQIFFPWKWFFAAQASALFTAALAVWWSWRVMRMTGQGVFTTAFYWALVVGALGSCGGFFGTMILTPEANQGPLLGIFITGPLGFILVTAD